VLRKVIDGFDALDRMEKQQVDQKDKLWNDIIIYKVTIHVNPLAKE